MLQMLANQALSGYVDELSKESGKTPEEVWNDLKVVHEAIAELGLSMANDLGYPEEAKLPIDDPRY